MIRHGDTIVVPKRQSGEPTGDSTMHTPETCAALDCANAPNRSDFHATVEDSPTIEREGAMSITTTQHSALGDLRRFGALYPSPRAHRGSPFGFSERTLQALVDAGYARWDVVRATTGAGTSIMRGIVPVIDSPEDEFPEDPDNLTGMDLGED